MYTHSVYVYDLAWVLCWLLDLEFGYLMSDSRGEHAAFHYSCRVSCFIFFGWAVTHAAQPMYNAPLHYSPRGSSVTGRSARSLSSVIRWPLTSAPLTPSPLQKPLLMRRTTPLTIPKWSILPKGWTKTLTSLSLRWRHLLLLLHAIARQFVRLSVCSRYAICLF